MMWEKRASKINRWGLFATRDIPKGTRIIQYKGPLVPAEKGERLLLNGAQYVCYWNRKYYIDGRPQWNPAGYLNHACYPNCNQRLRADGVWIYASRRIHKGEELTYDYCYPFDAGVSKYCKCGHVRCLGVMVSVPQRKRLRKIAQRVLEAMNNEKATRETE